MYTILNKLSLLVFCILLALVTTDISVSLVLLILACISISFLGYIYKIKKFHCFSFLGFALLGQFYLPSLYFLPVLFYDICYYKVFSITFLGFLALILQFSPYTIATITLCFISFLLCNNNLKILKLQNSYRILQDTTKEMQTELNTKNNELLEKHDIDIHNATLTERGRIAGEIHDNVGHLLTSSILQIGAILASNPSDAQIKTLNILQDTLSIGMDSIRESIHNLHDSASDLYDDVRKIINVKCEFSFDYDVDEQPNRQTHMCLVFAIKEALSNINKHSNATNVHISLHEHPVFYQLKIYDNGKSTKLTYGIGLKTMSERVYALKGRIHITTDDGYKIFISIPKV